MAASERAAAAAKEVLRAMETLVAWVVVCVVVRLDSVAGATEEVMVMVAAAVVVVVKEAAEAMVQAMMAA